MTLCSKNAINPKRDKPRIEIRIRLANIGGVSINPWALFNTKPSP
jgi:hypothetical protein